MSFLDFDLKLTLQTGCHIQAGFGSGSLHQAMVRDHNDAPFIPASSLKGRLKFHAQRFASIMSHHQPGLASQTEAVMNFLFGGRHQQGHLFLDNSALTEEILEERAMGLLREVRASNQIERTTRTVRQGHLRFFEALPARLVFQSQVRLQGGPQAKQSWLKLLKKGQHPTLHHHALAFLLGALKLCDQLGGGKTRGMGRVIPSTDAWRWKSLAQEEPLTHIHDWFQAYLHHMLNHQEAS